MKVTLIGGMRAEYPSNAPLLVGIENRKGLTEEQMEETKTMCNSLADENIGMPSMFTLTSALQEWLQDNNVPGQDGSMYSG